MAELEISSEISRSEQTLGILHPLTSPEWEEWPSLPVEMMNACSVYLNGTLYVGVWITAGPGLRAEASLHSFQPRVDSTWTVTDTPTYWYTLVVHNSELLLVGGIEYPTYETTNKVFTMRDGQFVEALPPMKERRHSLSAVSNGSALFVSGGWNTSGALSSVEVFKDGQWTTAPSLPSAAYSMKSALHGDQWYLITSLGKVFCASLQSLISGADQLPWETLPDAPNHYSAAAFFCGHLLSIGGGFPNPTTTIHAFSTFTQSWEHAAGLPLSLDCRRPTAVVLSSKQLIVSGGARVLYGKLKMTPFDASSHFTMRAIDRLKVSAGISVVEELVKHMPTAFPALAGVNVWDMYNHILGEWASGCGPHPRTWTELFRVLKELGLSKLAFRIEKYLTGSVPEDPPRPLPDEEGDSEEEKDDETPEQEILRLNNVLAEYISANSLLKKQLKKANINPEHHLKSEKVKEEQLNPASIKEEPTFDKDNQSPSFSLKHIKQETKADPQTTDEQASIHYNHLSGLAVTGEDVYTASLYYLGSELHSREIYFVVNCDNGIHNTFVSEEYSSKKAVLGVNQPIDFEEDSLTLDIPMAGAKVKGGWKITPMFHPTVIKKHVDQFKPGQRIPHCHLKAEMTSKRKKTAPKLFYQVKLVGAKDPYNIITIDLDPQQTLPETTFSDLVTFKPAVSSQGNEARELLMQPQSHVTRYPPSLGPRHYPVASHSRNMSELPPSLLSVEQSRTSLTLSSATPPLPPHWNTQLPQWSHTGPFQPAITSQPIATIDELVTHVGIDKDLLNQPCSTEHLAKIAHLVPNWQKYAIALGVNEPHILSISSNSLLDPEMKAQQVLSLWKQTNGFKATYSVLVDVCLQKKDVQLAECICNIVKEDLPRPHPITGEKREATKHTEQGPSDKRPRLNTASEDTLKLD